MSSACTLAGCGMRNIASCFFARRLRFEEKADGRGGSPETSGGSIVFDFTGGRPPKKSDGNGGKSARTEAEPSVVEEDYLVFRFREDGAIDIVNDGDGNDDDNGDGDGSGNVTAGDDVTLEKGDEKGSKDYYEIKEIKMDHFETCDSNLSDTSSGSFAFPILKIEEWIGSPVHMPKHENQSVRLNCCKF